MPDPVWQDSANARLRESRPHGYSAATSAPRWIEIELLGEDGKPVPSVPYKVVLPSGQVITGRLDQDGYARLDGISPDGVCDVSFPELDTDAWQYIESVDERGAGG